MAHQIDALPLSVRILFWTLRACMAGAQRAGLLRMEAESICAACQQSGATAHLTLHSQTGLQRLLDASEGQIALCLHAMCGLLQRRCSCLNMLSADR